MQIPLLHQQLLLSTERLREIHRSMMNNSPIPSAEIESLLQEIRRLYGIALQLGNENAIQLLNEIQLASAKLTPASTVAPSPSMDEIISHVASKEVEAAENVREELKIRSESPAMPVAKEESQQKKKSPDQEKVEQSTIAKTFTDPMTLAEKIASGNTKRVSDNLRTPVKDIKTAIGLNEKFQFINQLFKGDAQKYNSFIEELNSSSNGETAMNSIQKISDENDWESHASAAKLFLDVVGRKFQA